MMVMFKGMSRTEQNSKIGHAFENKHHAFS